MTTTVICDFCENEPRQVGEEHKPTPAAWIVSAQTLKDSTITTIKTRDACRRHVEAAAKWASEFAPTENFCQVVLRPLVSEEQT